MTAQLLLGLSILVVLHEGGHFVAARFFGMRVEKFYLFFDAGNFSFFKFKTNFGGFLIFANRFLAKRFSFFKG